MKEVELAPIREVVSDYDEIEARIIKAFREEIYIPLMKVMGAPSTTLQNAPNPILEALQAGRISYYKGSFRGRFSSAVSRELKRLGAKYQWNGKWTIPLSDVPYEIREGISVSLGRWQQTIASIEKKLSQMMPEEIADKIELEPLFDSTLWKVEKEFQKTVKGMTVAPTLTKEQAKKISDEYTHDMKRYIKDWTEKEIITLRKTIQEKAFQGNRYETMVKLIQKSYGVSHRKAKFLARQETSLLMTKFKETRYTDAGVNEYKWGCVAGSKLHPVRPMHKALEGKTFTWNNPPVTDKNGKRNNPGQDYNCRCFARPIVKF